MTTASHRPGARAAALRWTRAAVIALVAALAVLVHHETAAAIMHMPPAGTSGVASTHHGMHHTTTSATPAHTSGHPTPPGVTAPAGAHDDDGACSGPAMQHCSAAGVESVKLAPPHQPSVGRAPATHPGAGVGQDVAGSTGRPPPDLSVLSRLLL